jgi:hypothetical protein
MKIVGKIDSPVTDRCDKCKEFFKRGEEVSVTITGKDVLGWIGRTVKHQVCPKG